MTSRKAFNYSRKRGQLSLEVSQERGNGLSALPAPPAPAPKKHGSFSIFVVASAKINLDCLLALFLSCCEPEMLLWLGSKGIQGIPLPAHTGVQPSPSSSGQALVPIPYFSCPS